MSNIPPISDSEWEVMKVIWANELSTANSVIEVLSKTTSWKPMTIRTLINRLVTKGVLDYKVDEVDKKTYHYFSVVSENECVKEESKSFLKRVFDGSLNVMMANFLDVYELSDNQIEELKDILDNRKS